MSKSFKAYSELDSNQIIEYIRKDIRLKRMKDKEYAEYVMKCTPETLSRILAKKTPMTKELLKNIDRHAYMTKETIRKFYIPRPKDD